MNVRSAGIALLVAVAIAGGCGSDSEDSSDEAQKIVQQLKSLRRGEIFIQGMSPRVVGPYDFKPGGYIFTFDQAARSGGLTVALESKPRSRAQPYQLLVKSARASGTRPISLSGRLYVHIVDASGTYVLRFRPNQG
jgi:hypothetical protein